MSDLKSLRKSLEEIQKAESAIGSLKKLREKAAETGCLIVRDSNAYNTNYLSGRWAQKVICLLDDFIDEAEKELQPELDKVAVVNKLFDQGEGDKDE